MNRLPIRTYNKLVIVVGELEGELLGRETERLWENGWEGDQFHYILLYHLNFVHVLLIKYTHTRTYTLAYIIF